MDNAAEKYVTLGADVSVDFTERKSVFIGHAAPVKDEAAAMEYIAAKKREYSDATHNVWAYFLRGGASARCSDDGEPQGTAGLPVLEVMKKSGADNAVVVVTRYFGGILLGAGGLVRAYANAAKLAVEKAGIVTLLPHTLFSLVCSYSDHQKLKNELPKLGIITDSVGFDDRVRLSLAVLAEKYPDAAEKLTGLSAGRAVITVTGTDLR